MTRSDQPAGDRSDVVIAALVAGVIYAALVAVALLHHGGALFTVSLLAGTAGAALGWVIGIGLSPYGKGEREDFASIGKLVAGFLGGWGISKLETAMRAVATPGSLSRDTVEAALVLAGIALTSLLAAAALTYVSRRYWVDQPRTAAPQA